MVRQLAVLAVTILSAVSAFAQELEGTLRTDDGKLVDAPKTYPPNSKSNPLVPTFADVSYGEHERNKLDFWQAKSETPTPVIMILHGGGWIAGSKANVSRSPRFPNLRALVGRGISVAAINYRLIGKHTEGVAPPVKAPLHDTARALQFVRSKARQWNINKERIGSYGNSAGGCSSLWLAYHDDMADLKSADPVARESTRLWCAAGSNAQTTLDPKQLKKWFTNPGYGGHAFGDYAYGKDFEKFLADRKKLLPWIAEYSPFELVSVGDPPVYLSYGNKPPAMGLSTRSIHGATHGIGLKKRCTELGIACHVVHPDAPDAKYKSPTEYLIAALTTPVAQKHSAQDTESRPNPLDICFIPQPAFPKGTEAFSRNQPVQDGVPEIGCREEQYWVPGIEGHALRRGLPQWSFDRDCQRGHEILLPGPRLSDGARGQRGIFQVDLPKPSIADQPRGRREGLMQGRQVWKPRRLVYEAPVAINALGTPSLHPDLLEVMNNYE